MGAENERPGQEGKGWGKSRKLSGRRLAFIPDEMGRFEKVWSRKDDITTT